MWWNVEVCYKNTQTQNIEIQEVRITTIRESLTFMFTPELCWNPNPIKPGILGSTVTTGEAETKDNEGITEMFM